ncbi:hypothetical protein GCM10010109_82380 [Actinoplanes campanulatus]|nr:hypothetical protein GCM10010109_82380 [Actinoplanes campanulatus]GID41461.1 hypothetical protein Aca09nite_79670 [Actinoplanes campanulatus]
MCASTATNTQDHAKGQRGTKIPSRDRLASPIDCREHVTSRSDLDAIGDPAGKGLGSSTDPSHDYRIGHGE